MGAFRVVVGFGGARLRLVDTTVERAGETFLKELVWSRIPLSSGIQLIFLHCCVTYRVVQLNLDGLLVQFVSQLCVFNRIS